MRHVTSKQNSFYIKHSLTRAMPEWKINRTPAPGLQTVCIIKAYPFIKFFILHPNVCELEPTSKFYSHVSPLGSVRWLACHHCHWKPQILVRLLSHWGGCGCYSAPSGVVLTPASSPKKRVKTTHKVQLQRWFGSAAPLISIGRGALGAAYTPPLQCCKDTHTHLTGVYHFLLI